MKNQLSMEWVHPSSPERWADVSALAAKYGTVLRTDSVIAILADGRLLAVVQPVKVPVLNSVWDESMSPRQFAEGVNMIKNWSKLQFGECLMSNHLDSNVSPFMEKLGFHSTDQAVYIAE